MNQKNIDKLAQEYLSFKEATESRKPLYPYLSFYQYAAKMGWSTQTTEAVRLKFLDLRDDLTEHHRRSPCPTTNGNVTDDRVL